MLYSCRAQVNHLKKIGSMGTWALSFIFQCRDKNILYYKRINFYNGGIYHEKD